MCEIVLLCDDSGSMAQAIAEDGVDPNAVKRSTRWLELKKLAAEIIKVVTSHNSQTGLDIHFLNRNPVVGVTDISGLSQVFNSLPSGGTPLLGALKNIHNAKQGILNKGRKLLIVVITDGEPSDCTHQDLFNYLSTLVQNNNIHVSFAECTDNEEDMEYLDSWDGRLRNFDNTDDFRPEQRNVKMCNGQNFKFDYSDYVIKIILATYVRWYFNIDGQGNPGAKMFLGNKQNSKQGGFNQQGYGNQQGGFNQQQGGFNQQQGGFNQQQGFNQQGYGNNQGYGGNNQYGNQGYGGNNQYGNQGNQGNNQYGNQGYGGNNQYGNQGYGGNNQYGNQGNQGNNQYGNNQNQGYGNNQYGNSQGYGNNQYSQGYSQYNQGYGNQGGWQPNN